MLERFHISFKAALITLTLLLLFIPALVILPWMGHFHYNALKNIAVESGFLQNKWLLETVESEIKALGLTVKNRSYYEKQLIRFMEAAKKALQEGCKSRLL